MINLPFGYWAAEVTQRRMLRWMMEHAHFKIDSDLRQKKEALWAIETPHQKTCNFITEPFWGRCVLLSLFEALCPWDNRGNFSFLLSKDFKSTILKHSWIAIFTLPEISFSQHKEDYPLLLQNCSVFTPGIQHEILAFHLKRGKTSMEKFQMI